MLKPIEKIWNVVKKGFENEFKCSYFEDEAKKMIGQEMSFLASKDKKNLVEVLLRLYETANKSTGQVIVFQGMYQMVLIPYLLGLSQYNPFDAENCDRENYICNPRYIDISLHTSKDTFENIYFTLYCQFEGRVMLVSDEKDADQRYIIIAPEGIIIPDFYTKEFDFILPMICKNGGVVISIKLNKIIANYERLLRVVPSGTGYYLRKAAFSMIAVDEMDIWAGIMDSALLRDIMSRNAPNSLRDMVENLQDYYMDFFSPQFLYIQLATIMQEIMCMHLANPDDFFDTLITEREKTILDMFENVEIIDMFWDPLMREKANQIFYKKLSDRNTKFMAYTAEKYRDELLMCMAYINQE